MGFLKPAMAAILFLATVVLASAMDMSIISYDEKHGVSTTGRTEAEVLRIYEAWLVKHGKVQNSLVEKDRRFEIFKDNLRFIDEHNEKNLSYRLGLTRFADLTNSEYRSMYLGAKMEKKTERKSSQRYQARVGDALPDSVDWREKGAVAEVKDQGQSCLSCWAFSTTGAVEGINQIVTGDLITLSEQELIDCDTEPPNEGCLGGFAYNAFKFIIKNGGIHTDKDYPYEGVDGTCKQIRKNAKVVTIDTFENVPRYSEESLKKAVANQPISVSIDTRGPAFQSYESGIFDGTCGTDLSHEVLVVGYGTEDGKDYWIVKNSLGKSWGESGYIRMARNIESPSGKCGIAMAPYYPIKNGQKTLPQMREEIS